MRLARLDVAVELLPQCLALIPPSIRISRSDRSEVEGVVRLVLDVTNTGEPGGEWTCLVKVDGPRLTAAFGPA